MRHVLSTALGFLLMGWPTARAAQEERPKVDVRIRFDQRNAGIEYIGWAGLSGPDWREPGEGSELRLSLPADEYHLVATVYDTREAAKHCKLAVTLNGRAIGEFERGKGEGWFAWHLTLPKDAFAPAGKQSLRFVRSGSPIAVQEVRLLNYWPPVALPPPLPRFHRTGWNAHATHFMYAPIYSANELKDAVSYCDDLEYTMADGKRSFSSDYLNTPVFDLIAIWESLPSATTFRVTIEALNGHRKVLDRVEFQFLKVAQFDPHGNYPRAKRSYAEAGRLDAEYVLRRLDAWKQGPKGDLGAFPALFGSAYTRLLTTYARLAPESPRAKDALAVASNIGRFMIQSSTPKDWAYPNMPRSHGGEVLQVCRGAMAGLAYLDLLGATNDKSFLDAASAIADSLKATQRPEGRWPFRVNPRTGVVLEDYTSDQAEAILLLDALIADHGRKDLTGTRDKAVRWMLDNPVKTRHWQQQWDDVGLLPPYCNLEFYDAALFALYLLKHATPDNGYQKIALDIARYIEDQFVLWEPSAFPTALTPTVLEQYVCYQPIDWHVAHYIRLCQALHESRAVPKIPEIPEGAEVPKVENPVTAEIWLQKARAMADNLTAVQHPDGYFPTWMRRAKTPPVGQASSLPAGKMPAPLAVDYSDLWLNCTSYTGEILMRLDAYLAKLPTR